MCNQLVIYSIANFFNQSSMRWGKESMSRSVIQMRSMSRSVIQKVMDEEILYYQEREANTVQLAEEVMDLEGELNDEEEEQDPARLCLANLNGDDASCS
jgi:hypothetical protein